MFATRLSKIARQEFEHMMEQATAQSSDSEWSLSLYLVPKKINGDWRPCSDCCALNCVTILDCYLIPIYTRFHSYTAWQYYFLQAGLDASLSSDSSGTIQCCQDCYKNTIWTNWVHSHAIRAEEYCSNIPTLHESSVMWLEFLLRVHRWCPHCQPHTRRTQESLASSVVMFQQVWHSHQPYQVHAESERATLSGPPCYPTWSITSSRTSPGYQEFSTTQNITSTARILGLVNFYHQFIPQCATILTPLNSLLKSTLTNSCTLQWMPAVITAFQKMKDMLANVTLLSYT